MYLLPGETMSLAALRRRQYAGSSEVTATPATAGGKDDVEASAGMVEKTE